MEDKKFVFICSDYLPAGITFDDINNALDAKEAVPLTKENLAKIIDPEYLDMTEKDLLDHIKEHADEFDLNSIKDRPSLNQPRMAYAEDLDKDDELNQDFPEPEEDK